MVEVSGLLMTLLLLLLLPRLTRCDDWNATELIEPEGRLHLASSGMLKGVVSPCQSDPCFHGMCVDHANSTYSCFCEDGYTGYQCQTNWDECWNSPCRHGGTCVDGTGRYHCLCRHGFTGNDCEENIDECQSDPCQNGATCQDGENGYRCRCPPGYEGDYCQIDVSVCRHPPTNGSLTTLIYHREALPPTCQHGGRCIDGPGLDYHCICPPGWTGKNCETDVDECCSNPCQNGARCIDLIGSYQCACLHGFTGRNCESALERCNDSLCDHQGICWMEGGEPVCYCVPDYHGSQCESRYNECLLPGTKCLNGGRCVDQVDGYSCSCLHDWTGPRCQFRRNPSTVATASEKPRAVTTVLATTRPHVTSVTGISCPPTEGSEGTETTTTDSPYGRDDSLYDTASSSEDASTDSPSTDLTTLMPLAPGDDDQYLTMTTTELPMTSTAADDLESTTVTASRVERVTTKYKRRRPPSPPTITTTSMTTAVGPDYLYTVQERSPSELDGVTEAYYDATSPDQHDYDTFPSATTLPATKRATTSARLLPVTRFPAVTTPESGTCSSDACRNGGTCVITPDGWQCRCSWRHEGRRCERERKLRIPQFRGNSYLTYAVPERALDGDAGAKQQQQVVETRLEFSTTSPLGLISYVHSADANVYIAVYVERSVLKFRLSCGKQQMTLVETKYNVSDGAVHSIFMRLVKVEDRNTTNSYCMGSVKLNNSYSMNGEQRLVDSQHFSWPWRLHIGGKPSGTPTPTEIIFLPGLVGCAFGLEIDGHKTDMIRDAVQGKAIDDCPDSRTQCGGTRCLNGGACSLDEVTGEHRCLCPLGWSGDYCELRQCPCNPCQGNGSVCLMGLNDQMICLCPFGRTGSLCELAVNVTRPQFDGSLMGHSSYLSLSPPPFFRDHFELKLHFVTDDARQVALLFFIGQPVSAEEKDFVAVSFIRGHVALTWDLGSGARRIFTARPVAVSTMGGHSVHVGRRGRVAWLQVNNQPTVTGRSPGLNSALHPEPQMFLGGHSSFNHSQLPSDLPLHSGFRGCIYDVVFRSRDQESANSHYVPSVESGLGVRQCSIPSCRLRAGKDPADSSATGGDTANYDEDDNHPYIDDDC